MKIKSLIFIFILFIFTACKQDNEINSLDNRTTKKTMSYKQFTTILETNNYDYIKQVLENYNVNINEIKNNFTVLDRYESYLDRKVIKLLRSNGGMKYYEILKNKLEKACSIDCHKALNNLIYKNKNLKLDVFLKILDKNYDFLLFLLKNGFNPNKQVFENTMYIPESISHKKNGSLLDNMIRLNNKKAINLLKKYKAKRLCEIKKKNCESIIINKKCIRRFWDK